jgi:K+-transporting ATPase ATPase B chain
MASDLIVAEGTLPQKLAESAFLSSFSDETPEGRSIIKYINLHFGLSLQAPEGSEVVPFSAKTRMSGLDFMNGKSSVRKGSVEAIRNWVTGFKGTFPHDIEKVCNRISMGGGTPLVVAEGPRVLGVIHLKDVIKPGIRERFRRLSTMGIRTVMVTGDNPLTAAAIAAESGVSDFIAEADPARKLERIRAEQSAGHLVAYIGDGTNDAPALAQADVGVAMSSGTQIAREAGNMIDFDNDPAKLIDIVETGKQLLMTRGSLTTFSIANDIAKYFAILPALFMYLYGKNGGHGPLGALNIMHLATPQSAILSAIIFNALIIIALIPLALRGVKYKPLGASALLRRNLLIYGLGGIVTPFLGIKAIDMAVHFLGLA